MNKNGHGLIGFDRLRIPCIIGVYPHEREVEQDLFVSFRAKVDFVACAENDSIQDAVCYDEISKLCFSIATEGKFSLLETFAVQTLKRVLEVYSASWAWIKIEKPGALPQADRAVIELEMEK